MKHLLLFLLAISCISAGWRTDFRQSLQDAKASHKLVLLTFSGSDWCLPCIRMEKEVFGNDSFLHFAEAHLELVNADFPQLAKHQQDKALVQQNEMLAAEFNPEGHFPYMLLLTAEGKTLKTWSGYDGRKAEVIIAEITRFMETGKP